MFRDFVSLFVLPDEDEKELSILEQGVRKTIDSGHIEELITKLDLNEAVMTSDFQRTYRIGLASFFAYHTFEFLFNPIWMHGYVWFVYYPYYRKDLSNKKKKPPVKFNEHCEKTTNFSIILFIYECQLFVCIIQGSTSGTGRTRNNDICFLDADAMEISILDNERTPNELKMILTVLSVHYSSNTCGFTRHVQRVSTLMSVGIISGFIVMFVRGLQMKQRLFSAIHEGCYTIIVTFTFTLEVKVGVCLTLRLPFDSVYGFPIETKKTEKIAEKEMIREENINVENVAYSEDNLKKSN
ncbi:hypothetical protein PRIPAC_87205 [Pristionchus pacificus]|uniref:Uncharacterized protein n=1 Tax=Pristionchus pacificus TaxID=54126 RepID=A0A2A6CTR3_PRIPA|nr:hypothetical protein PRIPAC_87205 [Pristionchus pacificus]|eukprot:PDM81476.1 hypothetical protein PRIPAC_35352 [Pristionchus pacificus]